MIDKTIYNDAPEYYHLYLDPIQTNDLLSELEKSKTITQNLFESVGPDKEEYAYAPSKWTIKQVLRHIIDCERIYTYRALRFSRFDNTELPGFDENKYMDQIESSALNMDDLINEYLIVRDATTILFKMMSNEMLDFKAMANNLHFTTRSIGFITVGHNLHHCNIIKSRYLNGN